MDKNKQKTDEGHEQCGQKQELPKMISLEKGQILTLSQKLPKNERDLGKLIVAKGFKKLPKVQ